MRASDEKISLPSVFVCFWVNRGTWSEFYKLPYAQCKKRRHRRVDRMMHEADGRTYNTVRMYGTHDTVTVWETRRRSDGKNKTG